MEMVFRGNFIDSNKNKNRKRRMDRNNNKIKGKSNEIKIDGSIFRF